MEKADVGDDNGVVLTVVEKLDEAADDEVIDDETAADAVVEEVDVVMDFRTSARLEAVAISDVVCVCPGAVMKDKGPASVAECSC